MFCRFSHLYVFSLEKLIISINLFCLDLGHSCKLLRKNMGMIVINEGSLDVSKSIFLKKMSSHSAPFLCHQSSLTQILCLKSTKSVRSRSPSSYQTFCLLELYPWYMEAPRLGLELELQLPAYATATAMSDPSCICNLHCGS